MHWTGWPERHVIALPRLEPTDHVRYTKPKGSAVSIFWPRKWNRNLGFVILTTILKPNWTNVNYCQKCEKWNWKKPKIKKNHRCQNAHFWSNLEHKSILKDRNRALEPLETHKHKKSAVNNNASTFQPQKTKTYWPFSYFCEPVRTIWHRQSIDLDLNSPEHFFQLPSGSYIVPNGLICFRSFFAFSLIMCVDFHGFWFIFAQIW